MLWISWNSASGRFPAHRDYSAHPYAAYDSDSWPRLKTYGDQMTAAGGEDQRGARSGEPAGWFRHPLSGHGGSGPGGRARRHGHRQWAMVDLLKQHGGLVTPDIVGLYRDTDLAKKLLAGPSSTPLPDGTVALGRTLEDYLLEFSLSGGAADIVRMVLERGANALEPEAETWATPRAWAGKMKRDSVLALLRKHNA